MVSGILRHQKAWLQHSLCCRYCCTIPLMKSFCNKFRTTFCCTNSFLVILTFLTFCNSSCNNKKIYLLHFRLHATYSATVYATVYATVSATPLFYLQHFLQQYLNLDQLQTAIYTFPRCFGFELFCEQGGNSPQFPGGRYESRPDILSLSSYTIPESH